MAIYGHLAIGPCAINIGKWGIPEKSWENAAQHYLLNQYNMFLADFIAEKPFLKKIPLISFEYDTLAAKFYDQWKEVSYSKNKNSSEISEQNGTTCRYVQVKKRKKSQ